MQDTTTQKAINNALASVKMEGLNVSQDCIAWCEKLLNNEITMAQYINFVKGYEGV